MRSIITLLFTTLVLSLPNQSYSQEKNENQQAQTSESEKQNTDYVKKLNLDEEQALKFKAINKNYKENVSALKGKSKSKAYTKKLKALEKERDKELKNLLSDEQFKDYIKLRREKRKSLQTLIRKSNDQK
jgi:uncharacterized protein YggL (DUF469 family)